ncbi:MAG: class I SAM-dependent methyltransferase [Candidatus Omnitrophica bacterium]|nr:class I SAM-dependent methyltransferase [Candidatus Omnitrophota bacterium]
MCADFFQKFISPEATVLDVAAGHCEFINAIKAAKRIAVDINPDTAKFAESGVVVELTASCDMKNVASSSVDVVFMSNLLEHLTKEKIVKTVEECHRVLKTGGMILILQPNIRFAYRDYWMFFDHITPIDDRALVEVLQLHGFLIQEAIPRFLPYTAQGRSQRSLWCVRLYLRMPILWKFFGGQCFIRAQK